MKLFESNFLAPFKALGSVCSDIPPVYYYVPKQKDHGFICCALGNVACVYTIQPFRLRHTSNTLPDKITCLARYKTHLFAAFGNRIAILKNNRIVVKYMNIKVYAKFMVPFGEILVIIDHKNSIYVVDIETNETVLRIDGTPQFNVSAVVHPFTYMNKILLGSTDSRMRLLNFKSGKMLHEFFIPDLTNAKISVLEQSPAIDVIGIGMSNGYIHLRNIKYDQLICSFKQDGEITALAFRTDGIDSMFSANSIGSIAVWDLNAQSLVGQKLEAHSDKITSLYALPGASFLISSGEDNRMVKWALENEQALPERHTELEGHAKPVTSLAFYNDMQLISTSLDGSVRCYNVIRSDIMSKIGVAREWKKTDLSKDRFMDVRMEPIIELDVGWSREAVWDNVICRHRNSPVISTWTTRRRTKGEHLIYHKRFSKNPKYLTAYVTSIKLSACGNFAFIGYSSGHLDMFNVQSGQFKATFIDLKLKDKHEKKTNRFKDDDLTAHSSPITGLASDMVSRRLISGSSDGQIIFWTINPNLLVARLSVSVGIVKFKIERNNNLLAVALEGGHMAIIDILSYKVVRKIDKAHVNSQVISLTFSPDGKWLVSTDDKGFIKIWDVSTNSLIDVMLCESSCIDIAFSPSGEYIATCHTDQRAIFIWANKSLFLADIEIRSILEEDFLPSIPTKMPGIALEDLQSSDSEVEDEESLTRRVIIDEDEEEMETEEIQIIKENRNQLDPKLITLSGLPPSRWANLPDLDVIRSRNKPIEPPKKPKNAPFFIPTVATLDGFEFEKHDVENPIDREKMLMGKRKLLELESSFANSLIRSSTSDDFIRLFEILKSMSISAIDFEIRSLPTLALSKFLRMIAIVMKTLRNFELTQSYLATFLKIHREEIWTPEEDDDKEQREILQVLEEVHQIQTEIWPDLQNLFQENSAVSQWVRSAVV